MFARRTAPFGIGCESFSSLSSSVSQRPFACAAAWRPSKFVDLPHRGLSFTPLKRPLIAVSARIVLPTAGRGFTAAGSAHDTSKEATATRLSADAAKDFFKAATRFTRSLLWFLARSSGLRHVSPLPPFPDQAAAHEWTVAGRRQRRGICAHRPSAIPRAGVHTLQYKGSPRGPSEPALDERSRRLHSARRASGGAGRGGRCSRGHAALGFPAPGHAFETALAHLGVTNSSPLPLRQAWYLGLFILAPGAGAVLAGAAAMAGPARRVPLFTLAALGLLLAGFWVLRSLADA
jgi:hypothetical protein